MSNFVPTLGQVLCHVEKNLGAIVRRGLGPARGLASSFDCIPNVFAIAQRYFTEYFSIPAPYFHAVTGIGSRLLAPDVKFYGTINLGRIEGGVCDLSLAVGIFS